MNATRSVSPRCAISLTVWSCESISLFCWRDYSPSSWVRTYSAQRLMNALRSSAFCRWLRSHSSESIVVLLDTQLFDIRFELL